MKYQRVSIASLGYEVPPNVISSSAIEDRLAPVYERLGLQPGRLELMTGIKERRHFEDDIAPSTIATRAARKALEQAPALARRVGCVIHASVCRDFLEPATANVVHHALGLPDEAVVFDVSNACLGVLNGILIVANMIELGQIEAGLVVSGENGKPLLDSTIDALLSDPALTRRRMKGAFASLTIGSAGAAVLLARSDLLDGVSAASVGEDRTPHAVGRRGDARPGLSRPHRLIGAKLLSATQHNALCRGGAAEAGHAPAAHAPAARVPGAYAPDEQTLGDQALLEHASSAPRASVSAGVAAVSPVADTNIRAGGAVSMDTDAEALLHAGLDLAAANWRAFVETTGFATPDRIVTHQVGKAHHRLLCERLKLSPESAYITFDRLGNVGSASLPATLGLAVDDGFIREGDKVALLGIGSGLSSAMLAVEW